MLSNDELAAIRERDASMDASTPYIAERDRRALLAHIETLTAAVEALPTELVDRPLSDRYIHRAAVLAILRGDHMPPRGTVPVSRPTSAVPGVPSAVDTSENGPASGGPAAPLALDVERLREAHRHLFDKTGLGLFGGYVDALAAEYAALSERPVNRLWGPTDPRARHEATVVASAPDEGPTYAQKRRPRSFAASGRATGESKRPWYRAQAEHRAALAASAPDEGPPDVAYVVKLMENEGVVAWADDTHRQRFLEMIR